MNKLISASFFWQNDKPGGIGVTFGPPGFSSNELTMMFDGEVSKKFLRDSDNALGTNIVGDMMSQLKMVGELRMQSVPITNRLLILCALNILWLTRRGFIANDEFNGVQFIHELEGMPR